MIKDFIIGFSIPISSAILLYCFATVWNWRARKNAQPIKNAKVNEMKVTYDGKDNLFLHKEIGKGKMPDGRKCRLLQTNAGIHMEVYQDKKWKTFSVSYFDLSASMVDEIIEIEKKDAQHPKCEK